MGIDHIRSQLRESPTFGRALDASLDAIGFSAAYVGRLDTLPRVGPPKYVKDCIWGMMAFEPDELAIIDTPLLQRLRRIAQLGLTFLTYPSAEHSRFAHTLGVSHVVKRLIASISEVAERDQTIRAGSDSYQLYNLKPDSLVAQSLVHAALLHDVGHIAFSHAGESAFMSAAGAKIGGIDLEDFLAIFDNEDFESGLSECLSIAICLSPRFESFYGKVVGSANVQSRIDQICNFIGGVPHDPSFPGLANLISGAAVDADKIDYLNRDAQQCGIPVGVDVARIFLNSALVRIDESQAFALSRSKGRSSGQGRFVSGTHFIVNSSGIDTYDELASAKSVLYQRVYLHQLTRNAEQVLAEALRKAMRGGPARSSQKDLTDVFSWFEYGDDEFLADLNRNDHSRATALRLMTRDFPKRAFVVFRDACEPFVAMDDLFDSADWSGGRGAVALAEVDLTYHRQTTWRLFDQLVPFDPSARQQRLSELRDSIRAAATDLRTRVEPSFIRSALTGDEPYVGISPRYKLTPINEVLVREKTSIGHSGQWTKSEELANAQHIGRGVDYIHADTDWRLDVAVACTKVLYDLHSDEKPRQIEIGPIQDEDGKVSPTRVCARLLVRTQDVCARTGLDHDKLLTRMRQAAKAGYYGAAERVVPLTTTEMRECQTIAKHYASLKGEGGWHVTEGSTTAYIRQFPVELRIAMIGLLKNGTILGRGIIRDCIDRLVRDLSDNHRQPLVFARFSPNSGSQIGITLEQERKADYEARGHKFARTHSQLLAMLEGEPDAFVVFLDDQFATGGQACAQLLHWAGKPRSEWPPEIRNEKNIDETEISDTSRKRLLECKIRLAFLYGTDDGKRRIDELAGRLDFADLEAVFDEAIPHAPTTIPDDLRAFLTDVGRNLLKAVRHGAEASLSEVEEKQLEVDALGYGGVGSVMTTMSGAPSHAITALWCPGIYEKQPWIPIFLRRGYRRFLVLG